MIYYVYCFISSYIKFCFIKTVKNKSYLSKLDAFITLEILHPFSSSCIFSDVQFVSLFITSISISENNSFASIIVFLSLVLSSALLDTNATIVFIADNIEKNYRLTSKIRGALLYPAFVVTAAIIVGFLAVTIILPKLTGLIKEMQVEIPWYTRLLMIFSNFMRDYWWAVLIAAAGGIVGFIYYIKTEAGRKEWDNVKINLPVVGKLYRYIYITRFCNNFSVLLASGIPIVRALMVVGDVVNNSVFKAVILRAADEVKSGGNISTVFTRSDVIPPIVTHIIKIGEETGKMGEVLKSAASFYEQETDNMTKNLSTLIEPVLIILLGFAVGILVFAIILPIYSIADKIA